MQFRFVHLPLHSNPNGMVVAPIFPQSLSFISFHARNDKIYLNIHFELNSIESATGALIKILDDLQSKATAVDLRGRDE